MSSSQSALLSIIGSLGVALSAVIYVRRKASGAIRTTEAERLWEAAEKLRTDMQNQIGELRKEIAELRRVEREQELQIDQLHWKVRVLEEENQRLKGRE